MLDASLEPDSPAEAGGCVSRAASIGLRGRLPACHAAPLLRARRPGFRVMASWTRQGPRIEQKRQQQQQQQQLAVRVDGRRGSRSLRRRSHPGLPRRSRCACRSRGPTKTASAEAATRWTQGRWSLLSTMIRLSSQTTKWCGVQSLFVHTAQFLPLLPPLHVPPFWDPLFLPPLSLFGTVCPPLLCCLPCRPFPCRALRPLQSSPSSFPPLAPLRSLPSPLLQSLPFPVLLPQSQDPFLQSVPSLQPPLVPFEPSLSRPSNPFPPSFPQPPGHLCSPAPITPAFPSLPPSPFSARQRPVECE